MILYLDTSSLVKLYLEEKHSESVRRWTSNASVIATSCVAYPEAMAAFARRFREQDIDKKGFLKICTAIKKEWPEYAVVEIDEIIAGELAVKHGLRGFDSIHLEAALATLAGANDVFVAFSSFDSRLNAAAASEGFQIFNADTANE